MRLKVRKRTHCEENPRFCLFSGASTRKYDMKILSVRDTAFFNKIHGAAARFMNACAREDACNSQGGLSARRRSLPHCLYREWRASHSVCLVHAAIPREAQRGGKMNFNHHLRNKTDIWNLNLNNWNKELQSSHSDILVKLGHSKHINDAQYFVALHFLKS